MVLQLVWADCRQVHCSNSDKSDADFIRYWCHSLSINITWCQPASRGCEDHFATARQDRHQTPSVARVRLAVVDTRLASGHLRKDNCIWHVVWCVSRSILCVSHMMLRKSEGLPLKIARGTYVHLTLLKKLWSLNSRYSHSSNLCPPHDPCKNTFIDSLGIFVQSSLEGSSSKHQSVIGRALCVAWLMRHHEIWKSPMSPQWLPNIDCHAGRWQRSPILNCKQTWIVSKPGERYRLQNEISRTVRSAQTYNIFIGLSIQCHSKFTLQHKITASDICLRGS